MAEAQFLDDTLRIYARTPNARDWITHPDTLVPHSFYHNNLALRQHRNFSAADLAAATNVGIFGDSYTENVGMPVQYSFTEPLDYLLNQSGQRFNVLNFGVQGYDPLQSYLHSADFGHAADLDHVFYVFCPNDLTDLYERKQAYADGIRRWVRNEAIRKRWWSPLIRRLHASYLILDVTGLWASVLANTAETTVNINEYLKWAPDGRKEMRAIERAFRKGRLDDDDAKITLGIFRQLIHSWKVLAEQNGSTFSVVLLPLYPPQPFVVDLLNAADVEQIDLYACFGDIDPGHPQRPWISSPYRFKNDSHWNEEGNRLAAVCLYRVLEAKTGLSPLSEAELEEIIFQYYAAFEWAYPQDRAGGGD